MLNTLQLLSMPRCFCLADERVLVPALSLHNSFLPLIRSILDWPSQRPHHEKTWTGSKLLSRAAPFSCGSFLARHFSLAVLFSRLCSCAALFSCGSFLLRLFSFAPLVLSLSCSRASNCLCAGWILDPAFPPRSSRYARAHACEPPPPFPRASRVPLTRRSRSPAQTSKVGPGAGAGRAAGSSGAAADPFRR